jgi:hypothetical protein
MSSSNNRLTAGRQRVRRHAAALCPLCQMRPGTSEAFFGRGRREIEFLACQPCVTAMREDPRRWLELARRAFPRPGRG